ncbi:hypothetical protein JOB18_043874 [Scomber scombrus]|uniref:Uncharacterized protein n=1 Tax=Scomber scombrus TaxID=13677 RepID=A0AAV1NRP8_SCOSC
MVYNDCDGVDLFDCFAKDGGGFFSPLFVRAEPGSAVTASVKNPSSFTRNSDTKLAKTCRGFGQTRSTDIPTDTHRDLTDRVQLASHGGGKRNRCVQDFDLGSSQLFRSLDVLL